LNLAEPWLTVSFGITELNKLSVTVATLVSSVINETDSNVTDGIIRHSEGVDLLPANSTLAGMELALVQTFFLRSMADAKPRSSNCLTT
jgi:chromosome partitioning protein